MIPSLPVLCVAVLSFSFLELGVRAATTGDKVLAYARSQIGKPYCWGGEGPSCYDCSGLVEKVPPILFY